MESDFHFNPWCNKGFFGNKRLHVRPIHLSNFFALVYIKTIESNKDQPSWVFALIHWSHRTSKKYINIFITIHIDVFYLVGSGRIVDWYVLSLRFSSKELFFNGGNWTNIFLTPTFDLLQSPFVFLLSLWYYFQTKAF